MRDGQGRGPKKDLSHDVTGDLTADATTPGLHTGDVSAELAPTPSQDVDALFEKLGRMSSKQIEYLLFQSTQGFHFLFANLDIGKILRRPVDERTYFTEAKMKKVHGLLTGILDCATLQEKRSYLESLSVDDFELVVRSYFQLVENTILANTDLRH